jgi:hypothetical protein
MSGDVAVNERPLVGRQLIEHDAVELEVEGSVELWQRRHVHAAPRRKISGDGAVGALEYKRDWRTGIAWGISQLTNFKAGREGHKVGQPTLGQVKRLRLDLNQARTEIEELRRQQAPAGGALGDVYDLLGKVSGCGGRRQRHASQYQHQ